MRGKEVQGLFQDLVGGITPACAGKRARPSPCRSQSRDHPRACGEKRVGSLASVGLSGSPPRVRGKACRCPPLDTNQRITPACAGKRKPPPDRHKNWGDHPRMCGEKLLISAYFRFKRGSPPAYAGKSWRASKKPPGSSDHPRVCEEKNFLLLMTSRRSGSPPRVRGKVSAGKILLHDGGITPAYAGKSSIQHLTASLGEFKVQKGHPVFHLRQRLQVWPDHARHLRHDLILHASLSAGQGRRLCPGPCPDTAGSGMPRGPSPAKRPHTSPPAATPGGCRAWQSGATAPGSR